MASWADVHKWLNLSTFAELPPSYNVTPTQQVLVARDHDGKREGVALRWGLIPSWAKDAKMAQINARSETAATKPMFRAALKKRRCLILANGYYEWDKTSKPKQPYYYRMKDEKPFTFAGLWETWHGEGEPLETCAILTTDANTLAKEVHDRMPVILTGDDALAWLDPKIDDPQALTAILQSFDGKKMICYPVGVAVGNVRNNNASLIEALKV
jgi:putative SOS response-associated peptidase YedK